MIAMDDSTGAGDAGNSFPGDAAAEAADDPDDAGHEPNLQAAFANERTFLAWERTALALITAGLAITQLLPEFDFPGARRLLGLPLIALGTVIAILSFVEWRSNDDAMRHDRPLPRSWLPLVVAVVVGVVALIGLVLIIVEGAGS